MNKYLHYCTPMILGTFFGFLLGYKLGSNSNGKFNTISYENSKVNHNNKLYWSEYFKYMSDNGNDNNNNDNDNDNNNNNNNNDNDNNDNACVNNNNNNDNNNDNSDNSDNNNNDNSDNSDDNNNDNSVDDNKVYSGIKK